MKIEHIQIENFKPLDSIELRPRMINLVVGKNNAGKTSLLEAIFLGINEKPGTANYVDNPSAIINYLSHEGVIRLETGGEETSRLELKFRLLEPDELIKRLRTDLEERVDKLSGPEFVENIARFYKPNDRNPLSKPMLPDRIRTQEILDSALQNETLRDQFIRAVKESIEVTVKSGNEIYTGKTYKSILLELLRVLIEKTLNTGEKKNAIQNILLNQLFYLDRYQTLSEGIFGETKITGSPREKQKVFYLKDPLSYLKQLKSNKEPAEKLEFDIETIIKEENLVKNLLRFGFEAILVESSGGPKEILLDMMGDGFKTLISVLSLLTDSPRNSIILLEEPEVHLHPGYVIELVRNLISLSRSSGIQLFISTHSYDLIDSFLNMDELEEQDKKFLESEFVIIRLTKNNDIVLSEEIDYMMAKESLNTLLLDLRGI